MIRGGKEEEWFNVREGMREQRREGRCKQEGLGWSNHVSGQRGVIQWEVAMYMEVVGAER
jgi:hypothetical protein